MYRRILEDKQQPLQTYCQPHRAPFFKYFAQRHFQGIENRESLLSLTLIRAKDSTFASVGSPCGQTNLHVENSIQLCPVRCPASKVQSPTNVVRGSWLGVIHTCVIYILQCDWSIHHIFKLTTLYVWDDMRIKIPQRMTSPRQANMSKCHPRMPRRLGRVFFESEVEAWRNLLWEWGSFFEERGKRW